MQISRPQNSISAIELIPGIYLQTLFPEEYIPALRSGFSLYPANPRWSPLKFQAWKTGRQLRQAYDRGILTVQAGDRTLVLTDRRERCPEPACPVELCDPPLNPSSFTPLLC